MPKLTTLAATGSFSWTFWCPRSITLEGISYHSILTNRHALSHYCHSSPEICFLREENRSCEEFLFLLSLIPRHHSRSPTVPLLSSFFHTQFITCSLSTHSIRKHNHNLQPFHYRLPHKPTTSIQHSFPHTLFSLSPPPHPIPTPHSIQPSTPSTNPTLHVDAHTKSQQTGVRYDTHSITTLTFSSNSGCRPSQSFILYSRSAFSNNGDVQDRRLLCGVPEGEAHCLPCCRHCNPPYNA